MEDSNLDFATAFKIGPIYVSWYGILIVVGFLFFLLFSFFEWKKKKYDSFDFYLIFFVGGIVSLFGARIWYLIFNPSDIQSFVSFFSISSGRSILGSIFFGTIWVYYYTNRHASYIETRYAFSILLPNILLAQAIGRWGNFFQQDVYGNIMEDPSFLPNFILNGMYIQDENGIYFYRQPLFLYESIFDFLGWILITYFLKNNKKIKPGVHGGFYFLWYGSVRASMELFRDEQFIMRIGSVPTSFLLSIIFALFGLLMIIYYQYFYVNFTTWKHFFAKKWKELFFKKWKWKWNLLSFRINLIEYRLQIEQLEKEYREFSQKITLHKQNQFKRKIDLKY